MSIISQIMIHKSDVTIINNITRIINCQLKTIDSYVEIARFDPARRRFLARFRPHETGLLSLHSHYKWEDLRFIWKITFEIFIKYLRFWDPPSQIKRFLQKYLSVVVVVAYFIKIEKVRTRWLISHIRPQFIVKIGAFFVFL